MRALALGLMTLALGGCAAVDGARMQLAREGAALMDRAVDDAKWVTCQAASIGALERELAGDRARIMGWMLYCGKAGSAAVLQPPAQETRQWMQ